MPIHSNFDEALKTIECTTIFCLNAFESRKIEDSKSFRAEFESRNDVLNYHAWILEVPNGAWGNVFKSCILVYDGNWYMLERKHVDC